MDHHHHHLHTNQEELKNLIKVWTLVATSLSYSYFIASKLPKGIPRLLSLLPIFYLFFLLPFSLSSFHFGGTTAFFLVWLSNSKLLLFAFDQGPLSNSPSNLFHFISLASLPIKIDQNYRSKSNHQSPNSPILLPIKFLLLLLLFHSYNYKNSIHHNLILSIYCLHLYLELEIVLAISAIPARAIFGFELEPQFNEPYLSTSLQDFWGRRWNLMVTSILRPTVYYPVRRLFGTNNKKWGSSPAILATFVVSGLMHELIYFYLTRVNPTWEVTCFFVLHGVCVVAEVAVKKAVGDTWRLKGVVSGPLTVVFVGVTAVWLFFPQLLRNKMDDKAIMEYTIFVGFVKEKFFSCLLLFSSFIENKF